VRVIPVLDLLAGRAVWARGGARHAYAPVVSPLSAGPGGPGDATALARAFRDDLGCDECYVADLDAITGGPPQRVLLRALAVVGGRLLVDGGSASPQRARESLADGAARVVVGLETLHSFNALAAVVRAVGGERVVFSLDLRAGQAVLLPGARHRGTPLELAGRAVAVGVGALLALDLARVGTGLGVDLALVERLRGAHPDLELLAGGGVGGLRDVERLADAGCDGVLVATALHGGGLGRTELDVVRRRGGASPRRGGHPIDSR
jgi:HisA/HisF family protein